MTEHFDPLIRKFLDALRLAMPGMNGATCSGAIIAFPAR